MEVCRHIVAVFNVGNCSKCLTKTCKSEATKVKIHSLVCVHALCISALFSSIAMGAGAPVGTDAQSLGLTNLSDDLSRQELFKELLPQNAAEKRMYESFAVKNAFKFPADVGYDEALNQQRKDSLFGVDISHHNGKNFPIEHLRPNKSLFLYMKASQGTRFLDPQFANNWKRAGAAKIHRGAYHFLSSGEPGQDATAWGRQQAQTFIKIIKANGGLLGTDMPPAVDVEWDKGSASGPDRWSARKPDEIVAMIKAFSQQVELDLGRKPVIYTAHSWWGPRMGGEASFSKVADHQLWLADYSAKSQASEKPRTINKTVWALWQFTDKARLNSNEALQFDASIFKGVPADFYSTLGVKEF